MGVGMPGILYLQDFGEHVYTAWGHVAYHVGSSLRDKSGWRDVDVRLILPDDEYARLELGDPDRPHDNARWVSLVLAWSAFGKALTGLPIDFQIQERTHANAKNDGPRSALFRIDEAHVREKVAADAIERFKRERARQKAEHVCGLQGYCPGPPHFDPCCPACAEQAHSCT